MLRSIGCFVMAMASSHLKGTAAFSPPTPYRPTILTQLHSTPNPPENESIESYLQQNYPLFESLLSKIPNIYNTLRESDAANGYTLFVPSNSVMENQDPKRKLQIADPRNAEATEKLASYHVVPNGKVTQERLKREDWTVPKIDGVAALSIGGLLTLGGELRVGRSKTGGIFGFGAREDGGVVIGNNEAKVVKSVNVGVRGVVHEVDAFVAPDLIWRYFDILRIPGF
ncbi:hypothetical protein HJC23_000695 [Cyclotella cryptica]|uniref:FAS1 domain-containing protein n=1 Tax=Cyclotella cryptica TaxID=29204 RepID=A0ABD3QA74_9STRA|eukprot:CCRYP_007379-RA/>CCRYP_007379-RA protein AED:0.25 eAED:0.25 QI:177/1/1/1/0.5/0.33/3/589/226